jgi:phosphoglycolate phosphatase
MGGASFRFRRRTSAMAPVLLCDLDGTLVDTLHDLAAALNRVLAEHDLPALAEPAVRRLVGRGAARLVVDGFSLAGAPLPDPARAPMVRRFLDIYEAAPAAHSPPFEGVPATLARLTAAGWRLGVCTNKPQAPSERILRELDLAQYFEAVGGGDRFAARKPDGAHLHATLELMGGTTDPVVMVGDSQIDHAAARDAGATSVLVTYGYARAPLADLRPDALIDRFETLLEVLPGRIDGR